MPIRRTFTVLIDHTLHTARECNYHEVDGVWFCSCPLCDTQPANIRVDITQYGLDRLASVVMRECMQCGTEWFSEMIWLDSIPIPARTPITENR